MQKLVENQYDAYCKKVLRFKPIASRVLRDFIPEFQSLSLNEIHNMLDKDNLSDRMSVLNVEDITKPNAKIFYDLLCHIPYKDGLFVDFEPQGKISNYDAFVNRCIHTGSRMIVWQRNEKDGSFKDDFSDLKRCISIWIVIHPPVEHRGKVIRIVQKQSQMSETKTTNEKELNQQTILILCLHDEIDPTDNSALMMLSVLFSSKLSQNERVLYLEKSYGIVLTEAEREVVGQMCNAHEGVYEYGLEAGMTLGRAKGKAEGRIEGLKEKSFEIARKLLRMGLSVHVVADTTGLSLNEVEQLLNH